MLSYKKFFAREPFPLACEGCGVWGSVVTGLWNSQLQRAEATALPNHHKHRDYNRFITFPPPLIPFFLHPIFELREDTPQTHNPKCLNYALMAKLWWLQVLEVDW